MTLNLTIKIDNVQANNVIIEDRCLSTASLFYTYRNQTLVALIKIWKYDTAQAFHMFSSIFVRSLYVFVQDVETFLVDLVGSEQIPMSHLLRQLI
jgi:hypothetical protein